MKIPKQEKQVLQYISSGEVTHIVTRNIYSKYTLYKNNDSKLTKITTADEPIGFDDIVFS